MAPARPRAVALTVGTNTVTVVVTNNGSRTYTLTVKRETPFETFLTENAATGTDAGPADDFDGDGVANLLEYAFGSNPGSNSSGAGLLAYAVAPSQVAAPSLAPGSRRSPLKALPPRVDCRALFVRPKGSRHRRPHLPSKVQRQHDDLANLHRDADRSCR